VPDRRQKAKSPYTLDRNIPGAFEGETVTRRRFMVGSANAVGGIAVAAFTLPALGFALGPVFERQEFRWQDIGALAEFTDTNYTPTVIQIVAGIGEAGKSTAYVRKRNPQFDKDQPDEFNQIIAISTRCMHLGCPVRYIEASQRFICPCHGGVYDFTGARSGGPPVRPLDRFYTRIREGRVQLGPRYSVNSELQRYDPRDPGEPLDGIGPYAYPPRFSTPNPPPGAGQKGF
jgi:Rieske Fe-S protein